MTIYIHFTDKSRPAIRLFNVDAVADAGPAAVIVRMQFGAAQLHEGVSHVAAAPDAPATSGRTLAALGLVR